MKLKLPKASPSDVKRCGLDVEGNGGDKIGNNDLCNGFNEYGPTAKSS